MRQRDLIPRVFSTLTRGGVGFACLAAAWLAPDIRGEDLDLSKLPPPADLEVSFDRDIRPILESSCLRCHGPEKPKGGYRMTSREEAIRGGDSEEQAMFSGDSENSPLIHFVAHLIEEYEMPPVGKADVPPPLTPEQIGILRAWIDQGIDWPETPPEPARRLTLTPMFGWYFVDDDEDLFRDHHWVRDGVQGGLSEFSLTQRLDSETHFRVHGHALRNDYDVQLELKRRDLGYLRAGFEQYRRYYDNSGGYYEPFTPSISELNRDLYLDLSKVWFEAGLDRPGLPEVVLGYEFLHKDGDKSTTQWLPVTQGVTRNVGPSAKDIDEKVHLVRLDVRHHIQGIDLEDQFRYEYYDLETSRKGVRPYPFNTDGTFVMIDEGADHHHVVNTLTAQKQVKDWLLVSSGYLFTYLDGDADFEQATEDAAGAPAFGNYWNGRGITLREYGNVFNANAQLGPFDGLTMVFGVQPEFSHREGFGDVNYDEGLPPLGGTDIRPADIKGDSDRIIIQEQVDIRYAGIPYTILYGEARLKQEEINLYETKSGTPFDTVGDYRRDTDASNQTFDYRGGFHVSPWVRASLAGHYRKRLVYRDYDHNVDEAFGFSPAPGYSAFILAQDTDTDEVAARAVYRWTRWLKSTFRFQWEDTDYVTRTDAIPFLTPGGTLGDAGNFDARVYSVSLVMTPISRLYLSTTFSYTDSKIRTFSNGDASVAPYEGDIYSVLSSGSYAWNDKTDVLCSYSFSRGDYSQGNVAGGLPLGIEYDQHTLLAGIRRRLSRNMVTQIQYGFFYYDEDSSGGANQYTAHGIFSSLGIALP